MSKKLVQINVTCNGSTGRIMKQIQKKAIKNDWKAYSFFGRGNPSNENCFKIGNKFDIFFHVLVTRLFDLHGHASKRATKNMIKKIKKIDPDVIQLHNIHGYYLNIEILFTYLKTCNKKIIWTLHDCWAFTGHCSYFSYPKCDKWKKGCNNCPRKKEYPSSLIFDNSKREYEKKKKLFTGVKDLTIVTPSEWLKSLTEESFLKEYNIKVINNGIDLDVFKPTNTIDVKKKYNIPEGKNVILGVAAIWDRRKGLEDFLELSKVIDESYVIVLVGLNKKQIKKLPSNIIGIQRTENVEELANLYTISDVLFNSSKEESFSLVTVEAMACGTPVVAFNNSAISELIEKNKSGCLISLGESSKDIKDKIYELVNFKNEIILSKKYNIKNMETNYFNLYEENKKC